MHGVYGLIRNRRSTWSFIAVVICLTTFLHPHVVQAVTVTTTIAVSICGNAIPDVSEVCDDGSLFNDGGYSTSTSARHCLPDCSGFGPYCGDSILMPLYSEQCDDGNNASGDFCDYICKVEATSTGTSTPLTGSQGGASGLGGVNQGLIPVLAQTKVVILGKAYPNTTVNILKDGQVLGVVQTDASADFNYESGTLSPGPTTFGFWATDAAGLRSITFTTTFQVTQNAVSTVSNVYIPPTIDLKKKKLKLGDLAEVFGSSAPNAKISVYLDKDKDARVVATTSVQGSWSGAVPTDILENESFHTLKALFELSSTGDQAKSGFSQLLNFYVGDQDVGVPQSTDINNDGKVNLVDFSILLFNWGTSKRESDFNTDGKVNLTDFSILLFNWTG